MDWVRFGRLIGLTNSRFYGRLCCRVRCIYESCTRLDDDAHVRFLSKTYARELSTQARSTPCTIPREIFSLPTDCGVIRTIQFLSQGAVMMENRTASHNFVPAPAEPALRRRWEEPAIVLEAHSKSRASGSGRAAIVRPAALLTVSSALWGRRGTRARASKPNPA